MVSLFQSLLAWRELTNQEAESPTLLMRSFRGPESKKLVKEFPTILNYAERIHYKHFPDYQKWE